MTITYRTIHRMVADTFGLGLLGITEDTSMMTQRLHWLDRRPWMNRRTSRTVALAAVVLAGIFLLPMCESRGPTSVSENPPRPVAGSVWSAVILPDGDILLRQLADHPSRSRQETVAVDRVGARLRDLGALLVHLSPPYSERGRINGQTTDWGRFETIIAEIEGAGVAVRTDEVQLLPSAGGNRAHIVWIMSDGEIRIPRADGAWHFATVATLPRMLLSMNVDTVQVTATRVTGRPFAPASTDPRFTPVYAAIRDAGVVPFPSAGGTMGINVAGIDLPVYRRGISRTIPR